MAIPPLARYWYSQDTGEEQRCDSCGRRGNGNYHRLTVQPARKVTVEGVAMEELSVLLVCDACWSRHQRVRMQAPAVASGPGRR